MPNSPVSTSATPPLAISADRSRAPHQGKGCAFDFDVFTLLSVNLVDNAPSAERLTHLQRLEAEAIHIMREVAAISDRIVVLSSGQVVAQGTADELSQQTGESDLEEMFLSVTGSQEGW